MMCGLSGLPKLRQLVIAMGVAPVQATLRAASATAPIAPTRGFRYVCRPLQSVEAATPRLVPGMRITPASPPGRSIELARTVVSYCSYTHCFEATFGDPTTRRNASRRPAGGSTWRETSIVRSARTSSPSSPGRS